MMFNPFRRWWLSSSLSDTINLSGLAILQPGVYDYSVGKHKGKYEALVQSGSSSLGRIDPVEEAGDLKFKTYSPSKKENGSLESISTKQEQTHHLSTLGLPGVRF
jgi:hypothetical protein